MNPLYDPTTYVCRYEAFEIRTIDGRVHANILTGTIDITDVDFIRFDTDVDTNQGIPVLGSPVSEAQNIITESNALGVDILFPAADVNNPKFKFIRSISVRYTDIVSIEFIKLPSIAR